MTCMLARVGPGEASRKVSYWKHKYDKHRLAPRPVPGRIFAMDIPYMLYPLGLLLCQAIFHQYPDPLGLLLLCQAIFLPISGFRKVK
jgi:hypothetical protein